MEQKREFTEIDVGEIQFEDILLSQARMIQQSAEEAAGQGLEAPSYIENDVRKFLEATPRPMPMQITCSRAIEAPQTEGARVVDHCAPEMEFSAVLTGTNYLKRTGLADLPEAFCLTFTFLEIQDNKVNRSMLYIPVNSIDELKITGPLHNTN